MITYLGIGVLTFGILISVLMIVANHFLDHEACKIEKEDEEENEDQE